MLPMKTDGCQRCVTAETLFTPAQRIIEADGAYTTYAYECEVCGYEWNTEWSNEVVDA